RRPTAGFDSPPLPGLAHLCQRALRGSRCDKSRVPCSENLMIVRLSLVTSALAVAALVAPAQGAETVGQAASSAAKKTGHAVAETGREVGHATAEAGRTVGHATAEAGREVGHATAEAGRKTGHAVKKEAKKAKPASSPN